MRRLIPTWLSGGATKAKPKRRTKRRSVWVRRLRPALYLTASFAIITGAAGAGYWAWSTSALTRLTIAAETALIDTTVRAGLVVDDVLVEGRVETTREQLLRMIGVRRGDPILAIDTHAVRERLIQLGWVADATVQRRFPGTVFVRLQERKAMAIWQRKGTFVLVDGDGVDIGNQGLTRYTHLKVIVGNDAPRHAPALLDMLATAPPLMKRVQAAVWVGGRRWNLRLDDGIDIRLPEENPQAAWTRLATLERDKRLLSQDIIAVDLRIRDRLIVRRRGESAPNGGNST
ncbi:MAG: FtsQ-type POTRA domain-containing protein [Alphaproteobacteria bacterium]|nr:FtsQ-type POTRA domain-containing protein [Alphaproteobacteria bacterium]